MFSSQIEDLALKFNIQVSNLCQFLPQDKVDEFSKMNMCELLESTQKTVSLLMQVLHLRRNHNLYLWIDLSVKGLNYVVYYTMSLFRSEVWKCTSCSCV